MNNVYFCIKYCVMLSIVRNILAFGSTFAVIVLGTSFILQFAFGLITGKRLSNEMTNRVFVVIGVILALLLIPLYYFPC